MKLAMLWPRHPGCDVCRILWRMWISSGRFPLGPHARSPTCMNWRSSIGALYMLWLPYIVPFKLVSLPWPRWDGSPSAAWPGRLTTCELKGIVWGLLLVGLLGSKVPGLRESSLHEIRIPNFNILLYNQGRVVTFAKTVSRRTWGAQLGFYGSSD